MEPYPTMPDGTEDRPARRRVVAADIEALEAFTEGLRAADYQHGGRRSRVAAVGRLPSALALLELPGTARVTRALRTAVADLHNVAGWTSFDTGLTSDALRHFDTALALAADDNASLTSNVHYRLGRLWLHHDAPGWAMAELQLGERAALASGSALALAVVFANQAWARARMGVSDDAVALLSEARENFARSDEDPAPGWAAFFNAADLSALTGVVFTELARTVDPRFTELAVPALSVAVEGYSPGMARSRTLSLISLATCHLLDDQVDPAVALGEQAVDRCEELTSTRTTERLRPLRNEAARRRTNPDARALVERIRAFRPATDEPVGPDPDR